MQLASGKGKGATHRFGRSGDNDIMLVQPPFLQHLQHDATDKSGGSDNGYLHGYVFYRMSVIVPRFTSMALGLIMSA